MAVREKDSFEEPKGNPIIRIAMIALALLLLIAVVWFLYVQVTGVHGTKVEEAPPQIVDMLPPPPPPPPPPPTKPEEKPPEPTDAPKPTPAEPQPQAPAPMTQDAPAQSGSDSYGLQAGSGGGMGAPSSAGTCVGANCGKAPVGGGFSDAIYQRSLSSALQRRIERDNKLNRMVFTADFAIWVNGAGVVTRADIVRSSGDRQRDEMLKSVLQSASGLGAPPSSFSFPRRITVRGRRSV